MIYITKGQILFDNPSMVVCDQTGYYNDGDPIICASAQTPDEPACRYEAKFIAYGGNVYSITDSEKLAEEILKTDPASLFGKDGQAIAEEKMIENIEKVDTQIKPEETIPEPEIEPETEQEPEIETDPAPEIEVVPEPEVELVPEPETDPVPEIEVVPDPAQEIPAEIIPEIVPGVTPQPETAAEDVVRLFNKKSKRKIS